MLIYKAIEIILKHAIGFVSLSYNFWGCYLHFQNKQIYITSTHLYVNV